MKIGWEFVTFTKGRRCVVPKCRRFVHAGHVRVDWREGAVICADCWAAIMFGVDPGGDPVPEWEKERRRVQN